MEYELFAGWDEFYLLAGSAAAVLIGLIFVVITLLDDKPRSTITTGSRLYMGPIVLQVSFILTLSAAALAPRITAAQFAVITGIVASWGLYRAAVSTFGIERLRRSTDDPPHWSDTWYYGVIPGLLSLLLAVVALEFWREEDWAQYGLAAVVTGLMLVSIRNEWDLVTWIAPRHDSKKQFSGE
jgi:hypothetical protein